MAGGRVADLAVQPLRLDGRATASSTPTSTAIYSGHAVEAARVEARQGRGAAVAALVVHAVRRVRPPRRRRRRGRSPSPWGWRKKPPGMRRPLAHRADAVPLSQMAILAVAVDVVLGLGQDVVEQAQVTGDLAARTVGLGVARERPAMTARGRRLSVFASCAEVARAQRRASRARARHQRARPRELGLPQRRPQQLAGWPPPGRVRRRAARGVRTSAASRAPGRGTPGPRHRLPQCSRAGRGEATAADIIRAMPRARAGIGARRGRRPPAPRARAQDPELRQPVETAVCGR